MKSCPNCKMTNPDDANNCRRCDESLVSVSATSSAGAAPTRSSASHSDRMEVSITRIDVPFWNLVGFLVKLAIAMVPAGIVAGLILLLLQFVFAALGLGAFSLVR